MNKLSRDNCVIIALIQRLYESRLPRAIRLKVSVDEGEILSSSDISFIGRAHKETQQIIPLIDKHPKYQSLFADVIHLFHNITEQALDNEQKSTKSISPTIYPR